MKSLSVCILFGGVSPEHEVSLRSAESVLNNIDKSKYNVFPVGITKEGKWILYGGKDYSLLPTGQWEKHPKNRRAAISPVRGQGLLSFEGDCVVRERIDVVFPVLHGENGEDGTIQGLKMDIPEIPELMIDNTDRNRTSPFAFTGNRFEFRAVGSEANCASSLIVLNAAVAEALQNFKTRVDALIEAGEDKTSAIIDVVREDIKTCKPIRFDGNGYSDEWKEEAQKRGLDCEASCPVVFDRYLDKESIDMFAKTNVMSESELKARNEVKWEIYTKKIQIEARVMGDLSMNHIIPVATHYQSRLAKNVEGMINIFGGEEGKKLTARNVKIIREIAERTQTIETGVEALVNARKVANRIESEREKAVAYHDTVAPKMEEIRYQIDKLELLVADELWTLPKYRELLFIR